MTSSLTYKNYLIYFLLILIIAFSAWQNGLSAPYQFDDFITPVQDPASQGLSPWLHSLGSTLRPLSKLSYAFENDLGWNSAPQKRYFQFTLLAFNVVLFLLLLLNKLKLKPLISFLGAGIWSINPIHSETIISLAGRPTLLAEFFLLLYFYNLDNANKKLRLFILLLGCLCKEVLIPLLIFEFLKSYLFNNILLNKIDYKENKKFKIQKILLSIFIICSLIALAKILNLIQLLKYSFNHVYQQIYWSEAIASVSQGIFLSLMPWKVSIDPEIFSAELYCLITILILLGLYFKYFRNRNVNTNNTSNQSTNYLFYWFLLVIPLQILPLKLDPLALRTLSLLSVPLFLFLAQLIQKKQSSKSWALIITAFLCPLFLIMFYFTSIISGEYQDSTRLWKRAFTLSYFKSRPCINYAQSLYEKGQRSQALTVLNIGIERIPYDIELQLKLSALKTMMNQQDPH